MNDLKNPEGELLDVVNDDDQIIDTLSRIEIHQKGLLHREVHIWFFDNEKNIFFQKRGVDKSSGGLLDATVGGHVDAGEEYLTGAIREVKEEVGLDIRKEDIFFLGKIKDISFNKEKNTVNNFFRSLYVYKFPILDNQLIKEQGVIGVDFVKYSQNFLSTIKPAEVLLFDQFILTDEIPLVIDYLNKNDA